jgi:cell division protein FtsW
MTTLFKYLKGDKVIWIMVLGMAVISMLVVFTSISSLAAKSHSVSYHFLKHTILLLLGLGVVFTVHQIPYKYFSKLALMLFWISIPLLALTLIFGQNLNNAYRSLVVAGLSFQTSDLAKVALIMLIARMLSKDREKIGSFREFVLPVSARILLICGLIMPANLSTAMLLMITSFALLYIGKVKFFHLFSVGILSLAALILAMVLLAQVSDKTRIKTWEKRIETFFDKKGDEGYSEKDFQSVQSKVAVATGGFFGKGPGHSVQRNILPHPYSDFIYAIIIEEYGIPGGLTVLLIYLILLYRAGIIVRKSPTHFGAFLAIGLAMSLVFQGFINMGVCVGILPVTGQPLPFISMGGTSILFTSMAIGIILSVSRSNQEGELNEESESA